MAWAGKAKDSSTGGVVVVRGRARPSGSTLGAGNRDLVYFSACRAAGMICYSFLQGPGAESKVYREHGIPHTLGRLRHRVRSEVDNSLKPFGTVSFKGHIAARSCNRQFWRSEQRANDAALTRVKG